MITSRNRAVRRIPIVAVATLLVFATCSLAARPVRGGTGRHPDPSLAASPASHGVRSMASRSRSSP